MHAVSEEIHVRGFAVLEGVIPTDVVNSLNQRLDAIYSLQCEEVGGEDRLALINDADIVRGVLAYDATFLDLVRHPTILGAARALLGENIVLLMQNGVINRPERRQFQTNWHRDLNYQHWTSSRPIAVSTLICLEDFEEATGGTSFLPGSHRLEDFPSRAIVEMGQITPAASKGSVIAFDSMVFHRSGINNSGRVRRAINQVFGRPFLAQQIDIPGMLGPEEPTDPELSALLGYRWRPAPNVASWRRRRIQGALGEVAISI